jgi:hypothetical protein
MLDGQIWRPFGASIYNASIPQSQATIDARVSEAVSQNLNILRIINFLPGGTTADLEYTEANWVAVDYLLHAARNAGIKVLLDNSDYCAKEMGRGVEPADQDWNTYADFVCNRVNTFNSRVYKNDDTIALLTMAGEISVSFNGQLVDFFTHSTQTFKAKGASQLTGVGSIEYYHSEIDSVAAIPTLDYIGTHPYQSNLGSRMETSLAEYGARSVLNNKPWIFEEFGNQAKIGDRAWASYMRRQYNRGLKYRAAGFLYWNLYPSTTQPNSSDDYNIGANGNAPLTEKTVKMYSYISNYSPRIPVEAAQQAGYPG